MAKGTHDFDADPRNANILIDVNGAHYPRAEAVVSVFDSGFMLGDGVWEGLRLHRGKFAFLAAHLDRLYEGAKAIAMNIGLSRDELIGRLDGIIDANGMRDEEGVHIRLDGDTRHSLDALSGPQSGHFACDNRDCPRI